jgi:segregation and condensation protein A
MDGSALHPPVPEALIVDVDGFEGPARPSFSRGPPSEGGPARDQILQLARQYLAFMERAARARIELAADYLVMAPGSPTSSRASSARGSEEETPAEELARELAFRLARLEAMREAGLRLMDLPALGRDVFARGEAEAVTETRTIRSRLPPRPPGCLRAARTRDEFRPFVMDREGVYTMEEALDRLRPLLGDLPTGRLSDWLPPGWHEGPRRRAATAATFAAALELVREGLAELRQDRPFTPVHLRARPAA